MKFPHMGLGTHADNLAFGQVRGRHAPYGAVKTQTEDVGGVDSKGVALILASVFVPWFFFVASFWLSSFSLQYESPSIVKLLITCLFLIVAALGFVALDRFRKKGDLLPSFIFASSLLACVIGTSLGWQNFTNNMRPFYDIQKLETYPSVNPSMYRGQQLMDAGQIIFSPGSHLNLTLSVGFNNYDVYCVAPIVGSEPMGRYDFWAVGINCCTGHLDFRCGEYNNPEARSGLRLMRDDLRPYYRLAVQQAEAAYSIQAPHPIFMSWLSDVTAEVDAYNDEGYTRFTLAVFQFLCFQLLLFGSSVFVWSKLG